MTTTTNPKQLWHTFYRYCQHNNNNNNNNNKSNNQKQLFAGLHLPQYNNDNRTNLGNLLLAVTADIPTTTMTWKNQTLADFYFQELAALQQQNKLCILFCRNCQHYNNTNNIKNNLDILYSHRLPASQQQQQYRETTLAHLSSSQQKHLWQRNET